MPSSNLLRSLGRNIRKNGLRSSSSQLALEIASDLFPTTYRWRLTPRLRDFCDAALSVHNSASELVAKYLPLAEFAGQPAGLTAEYRALEAELKARYRSSPLQYPDIEVGAGSSFLVYALVRLFRPTVLLETGVANGHSSFFILNALARNGSGTLHSIDVAADVGGLLHADEKKAWQLHLINPTSLARDFQIVMQSLPRLDFFLHDSDHSYPWQQREFQAARARLSQRAIFASDDVDSSFAFLDFCRTLSRKPVVLIDGYKLFGFLLPVTPPSR